MTQEQLFQVLKKLQRPLTQAEALYYSKVPRDLMEYALRNKTILDALDETIQSWTASNSKEAKVKNQTSFLVRIASDFPKTFVTSWTIIRLLKATKEEAILDYFTGIDDRKFRQIYYLDNLHPGILNIIQKYSSMETSREEGENRKERVDEIFDAAVREPEKFLEFSKKIFLSDDVAQFLDASENDEEYETRRNFLSLFWKSYRDDSQVPPFVFTYLRKNLTAIYRILPQGARYLNSKQDRDFMQALLHATSANVLTYAVDHYTTDIESQGKDDTDSRDYSNPRYIAVRTLAILSSAPNVKVAKILAKSLKELSPDLLTGFLKKIDGNSLFSSILFSIGEKNVNLLSASVHLLEDEGMKRYFSKPRPWKVTEEISAFFRSVEQMNDASYLDKVQWTLQEMEYSPLYLFQTINRFIKYAGTGAVCDTFLPWLANTKFSEEEISYIINGLTGLNDEFKTSEDSSARLQSFFTFCEDGKGYAKSNVTDSTTNYFKQCCKILNSEDAELKFNLASHISRTWDLALLNYLPLLDKMPTERLVQLKDSWEKDFSQTKWKELNGTTVCSALRILNTPDFNSEDTEKLLAKCESGDADTVSNSIYILEKLLKNTSNDSSSVHEYTALCMDAHTTLNVFGYLYNWQGSDVCSFAILHYPRVFDIERELMNVHPELSVADLAPLSNGSFVKVRDKELVRQSLMASQTAEEVKEKVAVISSVTEAIEKGTNGPHLPSTLPNGMLPILFELESNQTKWDQAGMTILYNIELAKNNEIALETVQDARQMRKRLGSKKKK